MEELENEDTDSLAIDFFSENFGVNLNTRDVARSHRLGPRPSAARRVLREKIFRPIIVRFQNYRDRFEVFANKKKLKGKPFSVTEILTSSRVDLPKNVNQKTWKKRMLDQMLYSTGAFFLKAF